MIAALHWLTAPFRWALVGIAAVLATWVAGRHYQRQRAADEAQRAALDNLQTRERIENAIEGDTDLVRRAASAGVVRHTER
jgi:hypothetical protein